MSELARIEAAEQALYQSWRVSCALRGVAFLLSETDGKGPSEWSGEPVLDLAALIGVLAQHGVEQADAGLEVLQGIRMDKLRATA